MYNTKLLNFVRSFKCHIPAAAIELFNLNTQCRTVFPLSGKKAVHLMEQYCLICPVKVKNCVSNTVDCQHANVVANDITTAQLAVQVIMAYVNVGQGLSRCLLSINFCRTKRFKNKTYKISKVYIYYTVLTYRNSFNS